eukprot:8728293-Alexandrium_andersonii.AAC.1
MGVSAGEFEQAGFTLDAVREAVFGAPGAATLPDVQPQPPCPDGEPNTFSDGSVSHPSKPRFSFAGAGV